MKLASSNHDSSALSRFMRHPFYFNLFLFLLVTIAVVALYTQLRFFLVSNHNNNNAETMKGEHESASFNSAAAAGGGGGGSGSLSSVSPSSSSLSLFSDHRIEQTLSEAQKLFELAQPSRRRKIKRFKTASVFPALAQENAANIGYSSESETIVAPSAVAMLTMEHDDEDVLADGDAPVPQVMIDSGGSDASAATSPASHAAHHQPAKRMSAKVYAKIMKELEDKGTRLVDVKP